MGDMHDSPEYTNRLINFTEAGDRMRVSTDDFQCIPYNGGPHAQFVHVANSVCPVCREIVRSHGIAVGRPYMMLLHARCAPQYNYRKHWPHPMPLSAYTK